MSLTYTDWRQWRAAEPKTKGECALDELNPFEVFADLLPPPEQDDITPERVHASWCEQQGFPYAHEAVIGTGVRDLLGAAWPVLRARVATAWVPDDVYPLYRRIMDGDNLRGFSTSDGLNLTFLDDSGNDDLLLLPEPLHPVGRFLNADEITQLAAWLAAADGRWLLLDAVYDFGDHLSRDLTPLAAAERCVVLRSMSKAWLCRKQFGVAEFPAEFAGAVQDKATLPDREALSQCQAALNAAVLDRQRRRIAGAWEEVEREIGVHLAGWKRPETGYLTLLPGDWEHWRANGLRVVPASVFGSRREDLSMASCLAFARGAE